MIDAVLWTVLAILVLLAALGPRDTAEPERCRCPLCTANEADE